MALRLADYAVNEAGSASDLGAEKYFDIVMQQSGLEPSVAVLVTTVRSVKNQGQGDLDRGLPKMGQHIGILKTFGVPVVVAVNRFPGDTEADLKRLADYCATLGVSAALSEGFAKGAPGSTALAETVLETIAANPAPNVRPVYSLNEPLPEKMRWSLRKFTAQMTSTSASEPKKLEEFAAWGMTSYPSASRKRNFPDR